MTPATVSETVAKTETSQLQTVIDELNNLHFAIAIPSVCPFVRLSVRHTRNRMVNGINMDLHTLTFY